MIATITTTQEQTKNICSLNNNYYKINNTIKTTTTGSTKSNLFKMKIPNFVNAYNFFDLSVMAGCCCYCFFFVIIFFYSCFFFL